MLEKNFNTIVDKTFDECNSVLTQRGEYYSTDEDYLANPKKSAMLQGIRPEDSVAAYMSKHIVCIYNMLERERSEHVSFDLSDFNDKITDLINYSLIFKALLLERELIEDEKRKEAEKKKATTQRARK